MDTLELLLRAEISNIESRRSTSFTNKNADEAERLWKMRHRLEWQLELLLENHPDPQLN